MFTQPKASTKARGYGAEHQRLRAKLLPSAYGQPCTRCGKPMLPGQALHFDHTEDRTGYLGFAHAACNRKAGARKGARIANAKAPSNYTQRW
jgi:hypothetical protein